MDAAKKLSYFIWSYLAAWTPHNPDSSHPQTIFLHPGNDQPQIAFDFPFYFVCTVHQIAKQICTFVSGSQVGTMKIICVGSSIPFARLSLAIFTRFSKHGSDSRLRFACFHPDAESKIMARGFSRYS